MQSNNLSDDGPTVIGRHVGGRPAMHTPANPPGPDRAAVAWSKVQHHASALFEALDRLDEAGGAAKAAAVSRWTPDAMDRALATLQAAREGLTGAIVNLDQRR